MSKVVKVTKEQQETIDHLKKWHTANDLVWRYGNLHPEHRGIIGRMSPDQIVLSWHGHSEIEPEYESVTVGQAVDAFMEGKIVCCEYECNGRVKKEQYSQKSYTFIDINEKRLKASWYIVS